MGGGGIVGLVHDDASRACIGWAGQLADLSTRRTLSLVPVRRLARP